MNTFQYHLGIDLHKETSYWTLMNHERAVLYKKNLPTSKDGIERGVTEMGVTPALVEAAIEPVSQWGWYGDLLEEKGFTVRLVDVYKSKLIAGTKLKNDRVDSLTLADMMRSDFLPTAYRAPEATRDLREFMRHRAFLVRLRARVHAVASTKYSGSTGSFRRTPTSLVSKHNSGLERFPSERRMRPREASSRICGGNSPRESVHTMWYAVSVSVVHRTHSAS